MAVVSVRMDDATKRKFNAFCDSVGITVSAAVNMFAKMTIRENRLPFDVKGEHVPAPEDN
ncbi:MAG: type II toxin-antitoxin system RelB/DinJ family antitoxin [Fibrobacter sp.]|nr:type II toxin-antitoxin system RelB/DinJ family antitoxin [Fibrobacter sp.]